MTTILISAVVGLVFGLLFGKDKPEKEKEWKPKKKNFFIRIADEMGDSYW